MHAILELPCLVGDVMCSRREVMRVSVVVPTLLHVILVQGCGVHWVLSPSYLDAVSYRTG